MAQRWWCINLSDWPRTRFERVCVLTSTAIAYLGKVVEAYFRASGLDLPVKVDEFKA